MTATWPEQPVAVVTGATGGWGRGAAKALAQAGLRVVVNARTADAVHAFADELRAGGATAAAVPGSVDTLDGARAIVAGAVGQFGQVDVLVSCAGGGRGADLLDVTEAEWLAIITTELNGVFGCTRAVAEHLVERGAPGRIITVAGGAGMYGSRGDAAHAAVKGAVASATWGWAEELRPFAITVNAVRGGVRSAYIWPKLELFRATVGDPDAMPRDFGFYEPEEAGPIVAWLASREAADITGCYLGIDGPRVSYWRPAAPELSVFRTPSWTPEAIESEVGPALRQHLRRGRPMRPSDLLVAKYDMSEWWNLPVSTSGRNPDDPTPAGFWAEKPSPR